MNITYIIIILTFLSALIEKGSKKKYFDNVKILQKINWENFTIFLLALLLIFQLWESRKSNIKEEKKDFLSTETFNNVINTDKKISTANNKLESMLKSLDTEIQFTKDEFILIGELNKDITKVRTSIEKDLAEYKNLNSQYKEQIKIEHENINEAKPNLKIVNPVTLCDSSNFSFQFIFTNYGKQEIPDSIKYYSLLVLVDSNLTVSKIELIKSNFGEHNLLSIRRRVLFLYCKFRKIGKNENSKILRAFC